MERVLSIFLPQWDIQLHKRPSPNRRKIGPGVPPNPKPAVSHGAGPYAGPCASIPSTHAPTSNHHPLLLTRSTARLERVLRCCPIAAALGVRPGMLVADARAACGIDVALAPFDPDRSLHALHRLARWSQRFSPVVTVDPVPRNPGDTPDGLLLDMTGTAHLFGGEQLLLTEIATRLARMGLSSRLAIAPNIGAAWALARFAPEALVVCHAQRCAETLHSPIKDQNAVEHVRHKADARPLHPSPAQPSHRTTTHAPAMQNQNEEQAKIENPLDPLPVQALRLATETIEKLHSVGIERIAQLRILPRESLAHRFGEEVLLRIDQAHGRVPELLTPLHEEEPAAIVRPFDGPTLSLEGIFLRLQEMLSQLTEQLQHQESGIRGLRLVWIRLNAPPLTRDLVTATPSRDPRHLWKLLQPKVETMQMGYGIEAMSLTAFWTQAMPHHQAGIWQEEHADEDHAFREFLDRVLNRWGAGEGGGEEGGGGGGAEGACRVLTAAPAASHVPEEAQAFTPLNGETKKPRGDRGVGEGPLSPRGSVAASMVLLDRPTCLLDPPEPVDVLALQPDLPPARVCWRGEWREVFAGSGPERIVTPWWRVPPSPVRSVTRDYFKVETAAGWLWLFRDAGKWFVQGMWS